MILLSLLLDTRRLLTVRVIGLSVVRSIVTRLSVVRSRVIRPRLIRSMLIRSSLVRPRMIRSSLIRPRMIRSRVVRWRVIRSRVIRSRTLVALGPKFPLSSTCVCTSIDISKGIFQRKCLLAEIINVHRLCKTVVLDSIDRRSIHHDNIHHLCKMIRDTQAGLWAKSRKLTGEQLTNIQRGDAMYHFGNVVDDWRGLEVLGNDAVVEAPTVSSYVQRISIDHSGEELLGCDEGSDVW